MGLFSSAFNFLGNNAGWLGPAIGLGGALLGGGKEGPQSTNVSTSTSNPWGGALPTLNNAMSSVNNLYNSGAGTHYYPGQTYTPMGYDTSTALNQMRERAMDGSPVNDAAKSGVIDMIGGNGNPYLDSMVNKTMDQVGNRVNSNFSKAGRYGSVAHQDNLSDNLTDVANSMYGNQYSSDRNRSLRAIGMAPGIAENDYTDAGKLLGIGEVVEGYQGRQLEDDMNRFNFGEQQPFNLTNDYANLATRFAGLGGETTGNGTYTQPGDTFTQRLGNWGALGQDFGNMFGGFSKNLTNNKFQTNPYQNPWG